MRNKKVLDSPTIKLSGKKIVNVKGSVKDTKKFNKTTSTKLIDSAQIETIRISILNLKSRKDTTKNNFVEESYYFIKNRKRRIP